MRYLGNFFCRKYQGAVPVSEQKSAYPSWPAHCLWIQQEEAWYLCVRWVDTANLIWKPCIRIRTLSVECSFFLSGFIDSGSGSSILGWIPIRIRIQGCDDQKLEKIYSWKNNVNFFRSKIAVYLYLGLHTGRPTGEAFSPQKRTSITSKHEIS